MNKSKVLEKAEKEQEMDLETLEHLNIAMTRTLLIKYGASIIDISKVPPRKGHSDWYELFNLVPKGKALLIPHRYLSIHAFLIKLKKKGQFTDYYVTIQNGRTYIVHEEREGKEAKKP
jgi:hypothetical protein